MKTNNEFHLIVSICAFVNSICGIHFPFCIKKRILLSDDYFCCCIWIFRRNWHTMLCDCHHCCVIHWWYTEKNEAKRSHNGPITTSTDVEYIDFFLSTLLFEMCILLAWKSLAKIAFLDELTILFFAIGLHTKTHICILQNYSVQSFP